MVATEGSSSGFALMCTTQAEGGDAELLTLENGEILSALGFISE